MTDTAEYSKARKRAEAKFGFFVHAAIYTGVMVLLVVINMVNSPEKLWFIWPLLGWGVAVLLHGLGVFMSVDKNVFIDALTEQELKSADTANKAKDGEKNS